MSENESKTAKIEEKLNDITECSICAETFKEPKILSCIHTFCKHCLQELTSKLEKSTGEEVPCPICRKNFLIPAEGIDGLQKNFFMEKLVEMRSNLDPSNKNQNTCESCQDGDPSTDIGELPMADVFCTDCQQKLCKECHKYHLKSKLSKSHRIVTLQEQQQFSESVIVKTLPEVCHKHNMKPLDIYCSQCMDAVCSSCFFENHKSHDGSAVDSMVDELQKKIQESIDHLMNFVALFQEQKKKMEQKQNDFSEHFSKIENEVNRRREELKSLVDAHSDSLLSELRIEKEASLKTKGSYIDDIETLLLCIESFKAYCNQMMDVGSASSICKSIGSLNNRAAELEKQCHFQIQKTFEFPQLGSKIKRRKQKLLKSVAGTLIGEMGDIRPTGRSPKSTKSMSEATEAGIDDELTDARMLEKTVSLTARISELESVEEELNRKVKKLEQEVAQLRGSPSGENRGVINYNKGLMSHHELIRPRIAKDETCEVNGLALLGKELFIVCSGSCVVEVWNVETLQCERMWMLRDLKYPIDMKQCAADNCLYLLNTTGSPKSEILRVDTRGNLISSWLIKVSQSAGPINLSVTEDCNVLLTATRELIEYSKEGAILHTILFESNVREIKDSLKHSLKLCDDQYLISHGYENAALQRICLVDRSGNVLRFYGQDQCCKSSLNYPTYMERDSVGNILVADHINGRVLVLNPNLEILAIPLTSNDYRAMKREESYRYSFRPKKLCLCEELRKLIVYEDVWRQDKIDYNKPKQFVSRILSEFRFS